MLRSYFSRTIMSDNKKTPRDWESAIDKKIREAMERGEFDNLRGAGKPQNLDDDPHVPADWRLAFKVLKDAGVAPEWIERGKAIRAELQSLATFLEQQIRWQHERRAHCVYRQRAAALNKMIDTFNLQVPNVNLQLPRVRMEEETRRFEEACTNA